MKRPIKETKTLQQASSNYLRDPHGETERAFYEALAALEAAEREQYSSAFSRFGSVLRRQALPLGAAAILATLIGLFVFYQITTPPFLGRATPTLAPVTVRPIPSNTNPTSNLCAGGMDYVAQGLFLMGAGSQDNDASADEKPQRQVSLDAFCIDHTEVSNEQYALFSKATNHTPPSGWNGSSYPANVNQNYKDLPVVNVSWFDAREYCTWQRKQLPTEAQWEKAARGINGFLYPWGNTFDPTKANYGGTVPRVLSPVESFTSGQSPYSVLNMAGNVAEWVADWYLPDAYTRMPNLNPTGPTNSAAGNRVVRGGSYVSASKNLRTTAREGFFDPTRTQPDRGFRCAKQANQ